MTGVRHVRWSAHSVMRESLWAAHSRRSDATPLVPVDERIFRQVVGQCPGADAHEPGGVSLARSTLRARDESSRTRSIPRSGAASARACQTPAASPLASTVTASRVIVAPVVNTTARSIVFSSSRTLPGQ